MFTVKHVFHTPVISEDMKNPLMGGAVSVDTLEEALAWFKTKTTGKTNTPMTVSVICPAGTLVTEVAVGA